MQAQSMTCKQSHAEAVKLLDQAAGLLDEASGLFKAARSDGAVDIGYTSRRVSARTISDMTSQLVQSARETTCEDCDQLVEDCQCAWANTEVV